MRIAISGLSGCGNTTATKNVGQALNLKIVNYTFRDLAKDLEKSFDDIHHQALEVPIFDYLTDCSLIQNAKKHENIIIGTRLAAWMMDADLRIWLHAPIETRARRISQREPSMSYEETLYKTLKRDKENRVRYMRLYGIDIEDHNDFDMTINTEKLTAEQVSSLIVAAGKWAKDNKLDRRNPHLIRIIKLISENLNIPEDTIGSLHAPMINQKAVYESYVRSKSLAY